MERYVISPGILKEVGQEPAYVAGVMFGKTLDQFLAGESTTREVFTLADIIIKTGLPRNPAKHTLRRLIKRQIVVEGIVKNTFRLTWDALIHMCYVRDKVIELANDPFEQAASQWKAYQEQKQMIADMEAANAEADSVDNNDDSVHGRSEGEVQADDNGEAQEEEAAAE